ncbi:HAD family hydrolase [Snuella sedimenti]|uniref:HAD-IA family hydrolase n=1 Tax=Snuella sedimenti TaxID=2798802 RepID=A0A8J7LU03_9FLAO|nr:HAD-IA family hydrolase [Snuella sedimenti]MBJ6369006.1 HAD-IA family hydrolase [Snuella sedimenti]
MIKTIIFDFGDVFINLDKENASKNIFNILRIEKLSKEMIAVNDLYEQGLISTDEFITFYLENFPNLSKQSLIEAWNSILLDLPEYRLQFLKNLKTTTDYKLILLSNTNELHINWIKENISIYEIFKNCFDAFYLSHEINLRKPNTNIFEFVLNENNLNAAECLFIDDTSEHIISASALGIHTWNLDPKHEDVINLLEVKYDLF